MRSSFLHLQTIALLTAFAAPSLAGPYNGPYFTLGVGKPLVTDRLDPLLTPGKPASHVHSIIGGNAFAATMDYEKTQTSTCTNIPLKDDLSNYWMPTVYFHSKNGSFIRVPEKPFHKLYYKFGNSGNQRNPDVVEFPKGFRMMTGTSSLRSDDGSFENGGNQLNWQCHGKGSSPRATGFPKGFTECDADYLGGLAATMRFPSCWNGNDFDAAKPLAHMAFPKGDGLAGCPTGFQKARFAEIMVEYWLDVSPFNGEYSANDSPWVLSNGDPTGYGFHMDFINGWKPGVLGKAMKTCNVGVTADPLDSNECFGPGSLQDGKAKDACTIAPAVKEDIGGVLAALPGCNPIQAGPGPATTPKDCAGGTVANPISGPASSPSKSGPTKASTVPNSPSTTSKKPTATTPSSGGPQTSPPGSGGPSSGGSSSGLVPAQVNSKSGVWHAAGCYLDALNPRSLGGNPEWWGQPITSTNCVQHCDSLGKKYAGTENEGQCFCGDKLIGSQLKPGKCTSKCNGNKNEICGGPGYLSIYSLSGTVTKRSHRHHGRHFNGGI
ncbi:MAG: hypothetical protein LQ351_007008 [Letrouitia transgressa]|nr:MAG: hypothetical protein LQ351_007008 [Letrouitia transgressa]